MVGIGTFSPAVQFFESLSYENGNTCSGKAYVSAPKQQLIFCNADKIVNFITGLSEKIPVPMNKNTRSHDYKVWDHVIYSYIRPLYHVRTW